jgi:branched-subunit amino acid aminotransferase/4-amino-4-deoxychorismate lyase
MPSIDIIYPGEALALSPNDPGFAHGFGLFETICLRKARIELWQAHWQRLTWSAGELGIVCPYKESEVLAAVKALAGKLSTDAIIKLSLIKEDDASRLLVYSRADRPRPDRVGLLLMESCRVQETSPLAGHKTHNYLENLLALEAARKRSCFEALRLNSCGQLAEGAVSNLFFFREGHLHTPGRRAGLLPGVVREEVIQAFPVQEGDYAPADLLGAEAVFLTNASIGFLPVDWLLASGQEIHLASRKHESCRQVQCRLAERMERTAIPI